ncbi:low affinity iron permease family protein [Plastorhodobacter daqingensis]|uniref:Low affinity iron permease family protein n=1 Tax=Plastorhodobacter daqingensis TaxID=1387281 RepID=A0ABW2UL86_9RHOB
MPDTRPDTTTRTGPGLFVRFANLVAELAGRPLTFLMAVMLIIAWALTGPAFGFSETWQLIVNTGTTIVTFLMVFVLQNSQNRDGRALQAKLDELILHSQAENRFIGVERLDEKELRRLSELLHREAEAANEVAEQVEDDRKAQSG